jgi:hypothetical protein
VASRGRGAVGAASDIDARVLTMGVGRLLTGGISGL